jgi:phosphoglucosamine mutase
MISASHNPYEDNGIKLFGPDGFKLSDEVEIAIERELGADLKAGLADPAHIGRAKRIDDVQARYIEFVKATFPRHLKLDGLKVVVDCAHGAAYKVAPTVLWELGADVIPLGVEPNGFNINRYAGSTAPEAMCEAVMAHGADLGIALDGDADRVILADQNGKIIDGDQLMALIARTWAREQRLRGAGVVSTVMSNLGLERYLAGLELKLVRTQVGDRYVVDAMRQSGINLGGEQSGHIILSDFSTTGDGLIAALQVLAVVVGEGRSVSEAAHVFTSIPQILENVRVNGGPPAAILESAEVKAAISASEKALGTKGRILVRKSGTEPVIRVMGEGDNEADVKAAVARIVGAIREECRI